MAYLIQIIVGILIIAGVIGLVSAGLTILAAVVPWVLGAFVILVLIAAIFK